MQSIYEAFPLDASPERAEILSDLMRRIATTDSIFSDERCNNECFTKRLPEMCPGCLSRMRRVASVLTASDSRAWEVWSLAGAETHLVGVIFLTEVVPGLDAKAHYIFFDERLGDKTSVMQAVMREAYETLGLQRLTIEIPAPFVALAKHASKRLGFGGPFTTRLGETRLRVEGIKPNAALYRGSAVAVLVLGRLAEDETHKTEAPPQGSEASTPASQP